MQEQLSRCRKVEQRMEHDYKDIEVRVAPGAATELPRRAGAAQHRTCESGHPWRSDVLTCKDALMPWMHDAEERPDNPVHFHHLGNCSGNSAAAPGATLTPTSL